MKEKYTELSELLQKFLAKHPGTEDELCRDLKISRPTLVRWTEGKSAPHPIGRPSVIQYLNKKLSTEL